MKIYVMMHKVVDVHKMKGFNPLLVGSTRITDEISKDIIRDDTGDNISYKNPNYCELTGMYWMWKNSEAKDDEIIGLCHYRRYFIKNIFSVNFENYLKYDDIEKIMKKYDIILPARKMYKTQIKNTFNGAPSKEDMEKTKECIERLYPEYIESWNDFLNQKKSYLYNMFIAKKSIMDEYFKWLFDILFELEKVIDISAYNPYRARVYGFIAERLFNVWIIKNKDRILVKEKYVYNESESYLDFLKHEISNFYKRCIYGK